MGNEIPKNGNNYSNSTHNQGHGWHNKDSSLYNNCKGNNGNNNYNYNYDNKTKVPENARGSLTSLKENQRNSKWDPNGTKTDYDDEGSFGNYKALGMNNDLRLGTKIDGVQLTHDGGAIINVESVFSFEDIRDHVNKILNYKHIGWESTQSAGFIGEVQCFIENEIECLENDVYDGTNEERERRHALRWMERCRTIISVANRRDLAKGEINSRLDIIRQKRGISIKWDNAK